MQFSHFTYSSKTRDNFKPVAELIISTLKKAMKILQTGRKKYYPTSGLKQIMAKNENRVYVDIKCSECGVLTRRPISKNKKNTTEKLELKKFCKWCNKTTVHKEKK